MTHRTAALVLALLALAIPLAAAQPNASGFASVGTATLQLRSGYATWTPAARRLRIVTLPFDLTSEAIGMLEKIPGHDYVVVENPARPFVRLDLELDPKTTGAFSPGQVSFFNLSIWRPRGENANYSRQGNKVVGSLTIQGDFRKGAPIRVQASGVDGTRMKWNFKTSCRVFVVR